MGKAEDDGESQLSFVTLYKHRDGEQTTGCRASTKVPAGWVLDPSLCHTGIAISLCTEPRQHRMEERRRGKQKKAAIVKSSSAMGQKPHVKHYTCMTR